MYVNGKMVSHVCTHTHNTHTHNTPCLLRPYPPQKRKERKSHMKPSVSPIREVEASAGQISHTPIVFLLSTDPPWCPWAEIIQDMHA